MSQQGRAYAYAGAVVLLWSTVASAFKLALEHLSPLGLLFWSTAVSFVALLVIALAGGRLRSIRRWDRRQLARTALSGLLNPFVYYLVLFEAYDRLPAQEAQPLNFTWPVVLAVLAAPLLGHRLRLGSLAAMAVSFVGVVWIATRGAPLSMELSDELGVGLAVGSSVVWALYWIGIARDERDPVVRLAAGFGFGLVYVAAYGLFRGELELPSAAGWAGALWVGLFEMGVTFVLWQRALQLSRSTAQVANLVYLVPFLSLVVISLAVGETIRQSTVIGLLLIVAGIGLQTLTARRAERPSD